MNGLELAAVFMDRLLEVGVAPDSVIMFASMMMEARENGWGFVAIVVSGEDGKLNRGYEIRNDKARITIPPHPPYVSI